MDVVTYVTRFDKMIRMLPEVEVINGPGRSENGEITKSTCLLYADARMSRGYCIYIACRYSGAY